jgi:hypothetical protein
MLPRPARPDVESCPIQIVLPFTGAVRFYSRALFSVKDFLKFVSFVT